MITYQKPTTTSIGRKAEQLAADYLESLGYRIIERNFTYKKVGEIDIIAWQGNTLVIVEVKYRSTPWFSLPEFALSKRQLQRIISTAKVFLLKTGIRDTEIRFDLVAIDLFNGSNSIRHIQNIVG